MSKILDRKFICNLRHSINCNNFEALKVFLKSEKKEYILHINKLYDIINNLLNIINIDNNKQYVSFYDFHNINDFDDCYHGFYNKLDNLIKKNTNKYKKNKEYLNILLYIAKNYSEIITENHINKAVEYGAKPIYNILINHYIEKNIDESCDTCCFCFSSIQVQLIDNICSCKNKIHYFCLTDLVKNIDKQYCTLCLTPYIYAINDNNNIFFPYSNIYPQLSQNYKTVFINSNKKIQLYYAIAYLIVPRVQEILNEISINDFKEYTDGIDLDELFKYTVYDLNSSSIRQFKYAEELYQIEHILRLKNT
jgi:hypothetical protein